MSVIKITRNGQVTLPAAIRHALDVGEGDYLAAEVVEGVIELRPVKLTQPGEADRLLDSILGRVTYIGPSPAPSEEEVMEAVADEIHAMRAADATRGPR